MGFPQRCSLLSQACLLSGQTLQGWLFYWQRTFGWILLFAHLTFREHRELSVGYSPIIIFLFPPVRWVLPIRKLTLDKKESAQPCVTWNIKLETRHKLSEQRGHSIGILVLLSWSCLYSSPSSAFGRLFPTLCLWAVPWNGRPSKIHPWRLRKALCLN